MKKTEDELFDDLGDLRSQMRFLFNRCIEDWIEYEEVADHLKDSENYKRARAEWKEKITNYDGKEKFTVQTEMDSDLRNRPSARLTVCPWTLEAVTKWKRGPKGHRSLTKSAAKS